MNGFAKLSHKSRVGASVASIACLTLLVSLLLPSSAASSNANRADFGDSQTTILKSAKVLGGYVEFGNVATTVPPTNPATTIAPTTTQPTVTTKPSVISGTWENVTPAGVAFAWDGSGTNYGFHFLKADTRKAGVAYLGSSGQGFFKTDNGGASWRRVDNNNFSGRTWGIAIDKTNSTVYAAVGYGSNSLYKSTTGEGNWQDLFAGNSSRPAAAPYSVAIDPYNNNHLLVTFHTNGGAGQIAESFDAGSTWKWHNDGSRWGGGNYVFFLNNSNSWLVASQDPYKGIWKTTDAGASWKRVINNAHVHHGATQLYFSQSTNSYYLALSQGIFKSSNNGSSWQQVLKSPGDSVWPKEGYMAISGDGTKIVTHLANLGAGTTIAGPQPYMVADESNGTNWRAYNSQTFSNGASQIDYDPNTKTFFSANWGAGVFKLKS